MNDTTDEEIQRFVGSGYYNWKPNGFYIYPFCEAVNGDDAAIHFAYDHGPEDPAWYLDKTLYYKILEEERDQREEYITELEEKLPGEQELADLAETKSKISALTDLTIAVEYKTRFIPIFSGKSTCIEVNTLCSNLIKDLSLKKL